MRGLFLLEKLGGGVVGRSKWYYRQDYMLDRIKDYKFATPRADRSLRDMCTRCGWVYSYYRQLQRERVSLFDATYDCLDEGCKRYYHSRHGRRPAGAILKV